MIYESIRLPDVFGPFDNTDRHWKYQLWLKICDKYPIYLSNEDKKLSFVFRDDVIQVILSIIQSPTKVIGQIFNIAQVNYKKKRFRNYF